MSKMAKDLIKSALSLRKTAHSQFKNAQQFPDQKDEHLRSAKRCLSNAVLFISLAKGIKRHAKTI